VVFRAGSRSVWANGVAFVLRDTAADRSRGLATGRAMLRPYFSSSVRAQSDFGHSGPLGDYVYFQLGTLESDSLQKPGCRADRSECIRAFTTTFRLTRRQTMQKGTVKWFNPTKGYGFIRPSTGDKDVFVHISAVERAGLSTLNEGQVVEYELVTNRGKTSAENLKVA
jgi:cold shock protein